MTGYDWQKVAERTERESADLMRQLDAAWSHINLVYQHLADHGIELGDEALREHALEGRAIANANESKVRDLEDFRKGVVTLVFDGRDALDKGADPAKLARAVFERLLKMNDKAKKREHLKEGRKLARRQVEDALATHPRKART